MACTDEWYERWKAKKKSPYHALIHEMRGGGDDEAASSGNPRIGGDRRQAARLGTAFHRRAEYTLNGLPDTELESDGELSQRSRSSALLSSEWARAWVVCGAYRVVRSVQGWRARSLRMGQIDALLVDRDGQHYVFDFKRVAKHHKLDPAEKGFTSDKDTTQLGHVGLA